MTVIWSILLIALLFCVAALGLDLRNRRRSRPGHGTARLLGKPGQHQLSARELFAEYRRW